MTRKQRRDLRGAYKAMIKAIANYEKVASEIWAVEDDPRYFFEMFLDIYGGSRIDIFDSTVASNREEAVKTIAKAKEIADKAIGGIGDEVEHTTTSNGESITVVYHDNNGTTIGELYAYYKETE